MVKRVNARGAVLDVQFKDDLLILRHSSLVEDDLGVEFIANESKLCLVLDERCRENLVIKAVADENTDFAFLRNHQKAVRGELSDWAISRVEMRSDLLRLYFKKDEHTQEQVILLSNVSGLTLFDVGTEEQVVFNDSSKNSGKRMITAEVSAPNMKIKKVSLGVVGGIAVLERRFCLENGETDAGALEELVRPNYVLKGDPYWIL